MSPPATARICYLVTYDVSDPRRLRKVFRVMRGWGDHLQLSVFRCELTDQELVECKSQLAEVIHHDEDQVLFVDIGPADGRSIGAIEAMGKLYVHPEQVAVIV